MFRPLVPALILSLLLAGCVTEGAAMERVEAAKAAAYAAGFDEGNRTGYVLGQPEGWREGYALGFANGSAISAISRAEGRSEGEEAIRSTWALANSTRDADRYEWAFADWNLTATHSAFLAALEAYRDKTLTIDELKVSRDAALRSIDENRSAIQQKAWTPEREASATQLAASAAEWRRAIIVNYNCFSSELPADCPQANNVWLKATIAQVAALRLTPEVRDLTR